MTPALPPRVVTLSNWMEPPFNRDAFGRVRELVPTAPIRNTTGTVNRLPERPVALDALPVASGDGATVPLAEHLDSTYCDAICVVHDGAIAYERYFGNNRPDTRHLLMSVSKSVCGAALGVSVGRGLVSVDDLVCDVAPEFRGTSLDGATVQHVIDMATGTDFVEDYDLYDDGGGDSPLIEYERQAGYRPLGDRPVVGTLGHFRTYGSAYPHGDRFDYRSPLTNVAARVLEVVNGVRYPDLVSRDVWGPLGQECSADIMLDPLGHPVVEGGMSCTVRDLARFGLVYLDDGVAGGVQVIPQAWVADTRRGDDDAVRRFAQGGFADTGWALYRDGWWVMQRDEVFSGLGIFGQYCYVHRPTRTVIARTSTFPSALPNELSDLTMAVFETICAALA